MTTLEQAEKLRERANVTFEEAKDALERCGGDMLDAVIYLEKQGKTMPPETGGGCCGGRGDGRDRHEKGEGERGTREGSGAAFFRKLGRLLLKLFDIGNRNYIDAIKNETTLFSCPVIVLAVLLIFFFWVITPLFVVSLFFGFKYRFRGEELGVEKVNEVMDKVSETAEGIKSQFEEK
jgi:hypothetical protein